MKIQHLRDGLERMKELNGDLDVFFGDNPEMKGSGLEWENHPIQAIFEHGGTVMLLSAEVTEALNPMLSKSSGHPGTKTEITSDHEAGVVEIKMTRVGIKTAGER